MMRLEKYHATNSPLPLAGEGPGERAAEDESEKRLRILANAKSLRTRQTETEQRLWYHLRAHRFMGIKFKRQKPIGQYIVDFVCMEQQLIIELDGGQHSEQESYDQRRDVWLRGQGYTVLRFWNNDVMQNLEGVLEQIRFTIAPPSPPAPLPQAGEGSKNQSPRSLAGEG